MPVGLKVKPDLVPVQRRLVRLREALDNPKAGLENAAKELTRRIRFRFDFKRDPDGNRWAPWSAKTAAANKRKPQRKLMLDTRDLRDGTRFIAGKKDLRTVFGTPYGQYHEQADGAGKGRLPRRAFLFSKRGTGRGLATSDENYLLNALRYQLEKAARD